VGHRERRLLRVSTETEPGESFPLTNDGPQRTLSRIRLLHFPERLAQDGQHDAVLLGLELFLDGDQGLLVNDPYTEPFPDIDFVCMRQQVRIVEVSADGGEQATRPVDRQQIEMTASGKVARNPLVTTFLQDLKLWNPNTPADSVAPARIPCTGGQVESALRSKVKSSSLGGISIHRGLKRHSNSGLA